MSAVRFATRSSILSGLLWVLFLLAIFGSGAAAASLNRGRIWIHDGNEGTAFLEKVQEIAPAEHSILVLSYQPMVYFLCERRNPAPLELSLPRR
jgi:hypothetical protein